MFIFRKAAAYEHQAPKQVLFTGLFLALLSAVLIMTDIEPLAQLDRFSYDVMLRALGEKDPNPDIVIVDIDEESLNTHGQWPWPRHLLARLLSRVRDGEPSGIGVDILFPESDRTSLGPIIKELRADYGMEIDLERLPDEMIDHDLALARVLGRGSFYLGTTFRFGRDNSDTILLSSPQEPVTFNLKGDGRHVVAEADSVVAPIPILAENVDGYGFLNALTDSDGLIRKTPLVIKYQHRLYQSLGLAVFTRFKNSRSVTVELGTDRSQALVVGDTRIPLDREGNLEIRFNGPSGTYPHISATMILEGMVSPEIFREKIVFIGSSAEGLQDIHPTPFDLGVSGVEIQASIVGALLEKDFIVRPGLSSWLQGVGLFFVILIALVAELRFAAWVAGTIFFVLLTIFPLLTFMLFYTSQIFISPTSPLVLYVISFTLLALVRFRSEEIRSMHYERQLVAAQDMAIVGLASIVETRDTETGRHILRTQKYVQTLARYLSKHNPDKYYFHPKDIELLYKSSALHDVGKVGVPDNILLKPGPLTHDEFEEMKKHTLYGAQALEKADDVAREAHEPPFLEMAQEIALTHHERWDGNGYPKGLKGEQIPVSGRLMAIADVYDALISRRVYKKPKSHQEAYAYILSGRGSHFDPQVVDAFIQLQDEFRAIAKSDKDSR